MHQLLFELYVWKKNEIIETRVQSIKDMVYSLKELPRYLNYIVQR